MHHVSRLPKLKPTIKTCKAIALPTLATKATTNAARVSEVAICKRRRTSSCTSSTLSSASGLHETSTSQESLTHIWIILPDGPRISDTHDQPGIFILMGASAVESLIHVHHSKIPSLPLLSFPHPRILVLCGGLPVLVSVPVPVTPL